MADLTLNEFQEKFGIRVITDCPYGDIRIEGFFPESLDYFQIEVGWKSLKSCNNKYVRHDGATYGGGYQTQDFRAKQAKKCFYIGIEDLVEDSGESRNWEYCGFERTKYVVCMTYLNRKRDTTYFCEV